MPRVYSYMRFSDPRQAAGSSASRQAEYAARWAAEHGLVLDEALSLRDEGLSAYHQRHVKIGALGVFLRAVEDGQVDAGSVLVVESLDRLSRAEPLQAQGQLAQIINAGITVVTAGDNQEYSREILRANPYKLFHSLAVMCRAFEESETKSKRVRAAIRRQCDAWQAGTWRGVIRNGRDPHWVRQEGNGFVLVADRAEALRLAIARFRAGLGATRIMRELADAGLNLTESGKLVAGHLYKTLRSRMLIGERSFVVGGEAYALAGYYPPLIDPADFDALQLALTQRQGRRGAGKIPSLITGMGIAVCGYCGGAIVSQNLMGRRRQPDGRPWPGHMRLTCTTAANGRGCPVGGSIQSTPVEHALILYAADAMRMEALAGGGDQGAGLRADIARNRRRLAETDARLDRLAGLLSEDGGTAPQAVLRQIRALETEADAARAAIADTERELAAFRPAASPGLAARWLDLIDGIEALEVEARLQARELVRASFARITLWHSEAGGKAFDLELAVRGGGAQRMRFDRATGGMIEG